MTVARPCTGMAARSDTSAVRDGLVLVGPSRRIVEAVDESAWAALTDAERERAQVLRWENDRRDFLAAHLLVRQAAAMLTGSSAAAFAFVQRCDECGGAHGRPSFARHPDLYVSMSHTNGVASAACSWRPIGVDIEHWSNAPECYDDFAHVLTESERAMLDEYGTADCPAGPGLGRLAFLRLWVRKESLIKLGALTLDTLPTVDVSGALQPLASAYRWCCHTVIGRWHFLDWSDPSLRITGCAAGDGEVELVEVDG